MVDEQKLLKFFEKKPKVIDDEVGIYEYEREDVWGFTLEMFLIICEGYCSLTLTHKDINTPIFDIGYILVKSIECTDDKIIINQENKGRCALLYIKPNYGLFFDDGMPFMRK